MTDQPEQQPTGYVDKGPNIRARVDPQLKAAAAEILTAQGRTLTAVIEAALTAVIAQPPPTVDLLEAYDRDVRRAEALTVEAYDAIVGWAESTAVDPNRAYYAREARNGLHRALGDLERARTFPTSERNAQ